MKKILVVLLVLAVAGGVFAQQGEWSLGGSIQIGTRVDFDPDPATTLADGDDIRVTGITWDNWDSIKGSLNIGYTRGIFTGGVGLDNKGGVDGNFAFNGENFKAAAAIDGISIGNGAGAKIARLWGEYGFFSGILNLHVAYDTLDAEYWVSDKTGAFYSGKYKDAWEGDTDPFGFGNTFAKYDHHDLLKVAAELGAIEFGVAISETGVNKPSALFTGTQGWDSTKGTAPYDTKFVDAFKNILVGVKFAQHPFEIAAQFQFKNYGIYFGGTFEIGVVKIGLSFMGVLDKDYEDTDNDPKHIKFGASGNYNGGVFGAGLKAFFDYDQEWDPGYDLTAVGIEPTFFFNVLPNNLRFQLDFGLYLLTEKDALGGDKRKATVWAVQPQFIWNFLGTGASDFGGVQTGIGIRYRMAAADTNRLTNGNKYSANFLDVAFKWGF